MYIWLKLKGKNKIIFCRSCSINKLIISISLFILSNRVIQLLHSELLYLYNLFDCDQIGALLVCDYTFSENVTNIGTLSPFGIETSTKARCWRNLSFGGASLPHLRTTTASVKSLSTMPWRAKQKWKSDSDSVPLLPLTQC